MGRRRHRGRRWSSRLGDWIERTGAEALAGLFALSVRSVRAVLRAITGACARGWEWFLRRRPAIKLVLVALLALGAVAAARRGPPAPRPERPVYAASETEALARVIRSEIGTGTLQQRLHVAWATRNLARQREQTIAQMACSPCGRQQAGRPVSSKQDALEEDRELARLVLAADDALDPTGGATQFLNPRLQDELARSGRVPGYRGRTYERVRRTWRDVYGWERYYRLGPDLEFWGPPRAARGRAR